MTEEEWIKAGAIDRLSIAPSDQTSEEAPNG
jgi:hypothetical protein